jgi:hypothetical protein
MHTYDEISVAISYQERTWMELCHLKTENSYVSGISLYSHGADHTENASSIVVEARLSRRCIATVAERTA